MDGVTQVIRRLLRDAHGLEPDDDDDFRIQSAAQLQSSFNEIVGTVTVVMGGIVGISLLVGGIGIMNIMLVSVTERTREIGVRMATGARQRDILAQFLAEAIVVTAVGGIMGVLLGVGGGLLIPLFFEMDVVFTPKVMILSFCCAAAIGLIFGFAPARKAARLDPVVALANE